MARWVPALGPGRGCPWQHNCCCVLLGPLPFVALPSCFSMPSSYAQNPSTKPPAQLPLRHTVPHATASPRCCAAAVELGDKHSQPQMSPGVTDMEVLSSCRSANHDLIVAPPPAPNPVLRALRWYLSWAVPGMGMFSEAYMIFSVSRGVPALLPTPLTLC